MSIKASTFNFCNPNEDVCLMLTSSWEPVGITNAREAIQKMIRCVGKKHKAVKAIDSLGAIHDFETWSETECLYDNQPYLRSANRAWPVPTILLTSKYFFYQPKNLNTVTISMMYDRYKGRCQICNKEKPIREMTVEHIKPRCKGGTSKPDNITMTCKACNNKKNDLFPFFTKEGKELEPFAQPGETIKRERVIPIKRPEWELFTSKYKKE